MPLFYSHNINETTSLGIWKIEEPEDFFLEKVPVKRNVSHPYKRLQHLAGRYLLLELEENFPLDQVKIADTRKPYLENDPFHFSISHAGNFAAAIVSSTHRVGVDVELISPRLKTIGHKFLSTDEAAFLESWHHLPQMHLQLITLLWSAKESLFKWYSLGGLAFSRDMQMQGTPSFEASDQIELPFLFRKGGDQELMVNGRIFKSLALTWVSS